MIISEELEADITVVKSLLLHILIASEELREIERLTYIGELLVYVLDDEDFEGGEDSCYAFMLTRELSDLLTVEDDCESFISKFKEILITREKYEFLHFLQL